MKKVVKCFALFLVIAIAFSIFAACGKATSAFKLIDKVNYNNSNIYFFSYEFKETVLFDLGYDEYDRETDEKISQLEVDEISSVLVDIESSNAIKSGIIYFSIEISDEDLAKNKYCIVLSYRNFQDYVNNPNIDLKTVEYWIN